MSSYIDVPLWVKQLAILSAMKAAEATVQSLLDGGPKSPKVNRRKKAVLVKPDDLYYTVLRSGRRIPKI